MIQRKDWLLEVSKSYLDSTGQSAEDYIDAIGQPGSEIDALGLFVLATLYEFHLSIFYLEGMWCSCSDKDFNQTSTMLTFCGQNSYLETCVAGKAQAYLDSLIHNTKQENMPSHNKESKVFGNQLDADAELTESDIEILEIVKLKNTKTEPKDVKPKIKQEIKTELHSIVGFSKPKDRGSTSKFATALKSLLKAKKEYTSIDIKKKNSQ